MSILNPKLFGLHVLSNLADVQIKSTSIRNLGLDPLDIEVIRGSKAAGMDRFDWFSFSRLQRPIFKNLDRLHAESKAFNGILLNRAGTDQTLFGNLDINGSFSGSAVRYRYRDFTKNKFGIADISTSRVSAWSSSDSRANSSNLTIQNRAKISYGAKVGIIGGGKIQFEPQHLAATPPNPELPAVTGQRLQTTIVPEAKEFPSEVPTSKIKCKINGEEVFLYAMKGIPLVFKGFFRNLDASIQITMANNVKASWKIVETGNPNAYSNYKDQGASNTSINYRSPISRERFIKFYYNPNKIISIQIRSVNIRELPATKLATCNTLDFAYNQLKIFPNFKFIAPSLTTLKTMRNPFYLSDIEDERKLNTLILNKIPDTLLVWDLEGSFPGSIQRNIISEYLPNLTSFNCGRGGGVQFFPDDRPSGSVEVQVPDGSNGKTKITGNNAGSDHFCPDVPRNIQAYSIGVNDFRHVDLNQIPPGGTAIDADGNSVTYPNGSYSFKTAPFLVNLNVAGAYSLSDSKSLTDPSDTDSVSHDLVSADVVDNSVSPSESKQATISSINYGSTNLKIPTNLSGCPSLKEYVSTYNRNHQNQLVINGTGAYKFGACAALERLIFHNTNLGQINFPNSFDNENLLILDLRNTNIKGGKPQTADAAQDNVITADTFKSAVKLQSILIESSSLLAKPIHPDAFLFNTELLEIIYRSGGRSTGNITNLFNTNSLLQSVRLNNNAFDGPVPSFSTASSTIVYIDLSTNKFTGTIPSYALNRLTDLYLQSNQLSTIGEPGSLPSLQRYEAHNNQLIGQIPNFELCTVLRTLTLNNNKLSGYVSGAFSKLGRIRFIDLSNNKLTTTALDNLLVDLKTNYETTPRGGVTINLKNQTSLQNSNVQLTPSETGFAAARFLVSKGWSMGITGGIPDEPEPE